MAARSGGRKAVQTAGKWDFHSADWTDGHLGYPRADQKVAPRVDHWEEKLVGELVVLRAWM